MKKFLIFAAIIGVLVFGGITPFIPSSKDCSTFHPHSEDFGGQDGVVRVLDYLIRTGDFKAWTGVLGRTVVSFSFNGIQAVLIYGTGNPSMFISSGGGEYVKRITMGLRKVTSLNGIDAVKQGIGVCRTSFASQMVSTPVMEPVSVPIPSPKEAASFSGILVTAFAVMVLLTGGLKMVRVI